MNPLRVLLLATLLSVSFSYTIYAAEPEESKLTTKIIKKRKASDIAEDDLVPAKRVKTQDISADPIHPSVLTYSQFSNDPLDFTEEQLLRDKLVALDAGGDYAIPTTDSGFKHLLSVDSDNHETVISFLNTFVPAFAHDRVQRVEPGPISIPILPHTGLKQTFMDVHVISEKGVHYVIEMQAKRHVNFDERALFYACATYSRQVEEGMFKDPTWYKALKPVIAIQVLDYDTNRARGISDTIEDVLPARVRLNPLPEGEFLKHYLMTCQKSAQKIDHLQLLQIELGRTPDNLYPPTVEFTEREWWLSIFKHAGKYTKTSIEELHSQGIKMPETIQNAFERLRYSKWNPREVREYKRDVVDREDNEVMLAIERAEGMEKGREEGRAEEKKNLARRLLQKNADMSVDEIVQLTELSSEEVMALKAEILLEKDTL